MPDEFTEDKLKKLNDFFNESNRWANLFVTIEEIAQDNEYLIRDLSKYNPNSTIPLLASLLTLPDLHSNCIRLEILLVLAVVHCQGRKRASIKKVVQWFSKIGESKCVYSEDSAEDVFVSLLHDKNGNYRIIEGLWESAGFYTQRVLDVILTMPDIGNFRQIKKSIHALLVISDIVCENAGLYRYQLGSDQRYSVLSPLMIPNINTLTSNVTISLDELNKCDITLHDIEPFMLNQQMKTELSKQQIGHSYLDRHPLILNAKKHITVALPTSISIAVRDFVIEKIFNGKLVNNFDDNIAKTYSKLFFETPLLGGQMHAPVFWKKVGNHRFSSFYSEVDEGYIISYHIFLPSLHIHPDGGFKNIFIDDGAITTELQSTIKKVFNHFEKQNNFKEGLIVIIGCGWGKGFTTQEFELNHQNWRTERMSVADFVRLSWLSEMNPLYFWRLHDGLDAINEAGVQIINPNGILNLIGWVRSNDGHFVPHSQLPQDKEISPDQPLILNPPLNLLREVRADSDSGYDRHCVVDNIGTWHDVQRATPKPFFISESSQCVYASIEDLHKGTLTSVYEGAIQLWISINLPNINEKDIEYYLWEMGNEWLHRIGNALKQNGEIVTRKNLKVYVEFQDDNPPSEYGATPTFDDLASLCMIEPHEETNAYKIIFKPGFLAGFQIAENIAERLFVRTLLRAYLHLLREENCDDKAEAIEAIIVSNNDARSFHFFPPQRFIDYVQDTLPKDLIAIDQIDDAATKIGLGWRVLKRGQSNKIIGKESCTKFIEKVVDVLLDEIFNTFKMFNRLSTLKHLIANCEKANFEKNHWKRTSAAVLGLHGDKQDTINRFIEQMSKFTGASQSSRTLIEIALCLCPKEGGLNISDIELSKLIARIALVTQMGGLSDAIHYNALPPELTISPLGDILFLDEFGNNVVEPMLARVIGEKVIDDAPRQKENYEGPEIETEVKETISDEFWEIWKIEMGFDIDEARNILNTIEEKGIKDHVEFFTIKQSEYYTLVCSNHVSKEAAIRFLEQFSLSPRTRWNKPPKEFELKDIYPWRLGRRLSFSTRPILKVDNSDDPLLFIAPDSLRLGLAYVLYGTHSGRFEQNFFRTDEMKNTWWGKVREGHTFNAEVAKALSEAGWNVRSNIGLPELFKGKIDRDRGDIDVLAWRSDRKEVLVVECKDLSLARNYSEIAALLSEYQGVEIKGKADKLKKHLNRVTLIQDNREKVQCFTGVFEPQIVSCLVCSGVVPMQYAKIEALSSTLVGEISDILAV
ncbi:hypothetical protein ACFL6P_01395 [Candidatus Latescibacterota bacterium]